MDGECSCSCKKNDKKSVADNNTSKENYFVNGKSVSKQEFDEKMEQFENKYLDNVRDMLLGYCEFMDEMNEWANLFR